MKKVYYFEQLKNEGALYLGKSELFALKTKNFDTRAKYFKAKLSDFNSMTRHFKLDFKLRFELILASFRSVLSY